MCVVYMTHKNNIGVPQGSALFNAVMADFAHSLHSTPGLRFTIYTDDVSIWMIGGVTARQ